MANTLQIIYSGGTIDLDNSTSYAAQEDGWIPAVTYLRDSDFGGAGDYADVDEAVTVMVSGANYATRYANLQAIARAMDEATRWSRGANLSAVLLRHAPQGSGLGVNLDTVILGRPRGGENPFGLSTWYGAAANALPDNIVRFRRRGPWLRAEDTVNSTSSASNRRIVLTSASTHPISSPVRLTLTNCATNATNATTLGYLLTASGASHIHAYAATTGASLLSPTLTTPAEGSGTAPFATTVLRYTPNVAAPQFAAVAQWAAATLTANITDSRIVHIFATVRRTNLASPVPTMTVRARVALTNGAVLLGDLIEVTSPGYQTLYLGAFPVGGLMSTLELLLAGASQSANTYIDVDTIALLGENDEHAHIIPIVIPSGASGTLTVDHCALTKVDPEVTIGVGGPVEWYAAPYVTMTGTAIQVIWMSHGEAHWTNSGATTHTITALRRRAYLVPE